MKVTRSICFLVRYMDTVLLFGVCQMYRIIAGPGTWLDVSGYGRKFKDHRHLVGSSTLSQIATETSPSPRTAAFANELEGLQKRNFQNSVRAWELIA